MFFIPITYYCVIYRRFIRVLGGIVYVNSLDYIMVNGYEYENILIGILLIAKRELLKFENRVNIKNIPQLVLTKVLE